MKSEPRPKDRDRTWKQSLLMCSVRMPSSWQRAAPIQYDWCPIKNERPTRIKGGRREEGESREPSLSRGDRPQADSLGLGRTSSAESRLEFRLLAPRAETGHSSLFKAQFVGLCSTSPWTPSIRVPLRVLFWPRQYLGQGSNLHHSSHLSPCSDMLGP